MQKSWGGDGEAEGGDSGASSVPAAIRYCRHMKHFNVFKLTFTAFHLAAHCPRLLICNDITTYEYYPSSFSALRNLLRRIHHPASPGSRSHPNKSSLQSPRHKQVQYRHDRSLQHPENQSFVGLFQPKKLPHRHSGTRKMVSK